MRRQRSRLSTHSVGRFVSLGLLLAILLGIWVPEWQHWHVRPAELDAGVVLTLRQQPGTDRLAELSEMQLRGVSVPSSDRYSAAQAVLRGELRLPSFDPAVVSVPFEPAELTEGSAAWQLMVASLAAADVLLDGYLASKDEAMFLAARRYIDGFARFESTRWVDHGSMWNDHAISARVPVLIKFWAIERDRADADPALTNRLLALVARSALLLCEPSAYAWRTSHGILADLALLQIASAFPQLPESALARRMAQARFARHLDYWIIDEGATLLHSAGYHAGSLYHFSLGLRLFSLNGLPIAPAWWARFDRAVHFLADMQRPDGSLPMFGDTNSTALSASPLLTARRDSDGEALPLIPRALPRPHQGLKVFPVAGHAVAWDNAGDGPSTDLAPLVQTTLTWSYHPGLGHKLADEPSLLLWAHGQPWLTNAGYWPYGIAGRAGAESWAASNAPHLAGESPDSARRSVLHGLADSPVLRLLDVERTGPDGFRLRRQVIRLPRLDTWLVIDHGGDRAARPVETQWQFYPDLSLSTSSDGQQFVLSAASGRRLTLQVSSPQPLQTLVRHGSLAPFGGWVVLDRRPTAAPAVAVQTDSQNPWTMSAFRLTSSRDEPSAQQMSWHMQRWQGPTDWTVTLGKSIDAMTITRHADELQVRGGAQAAAQRLAIIRASDPSSAIQAVQTAFVQAQQSTTRFRELFPYRAKVSVWLTAAFVAQEVLLVLLTRFRWAAVLRLRSVSIAAWLAMGGWIPLVYLR